MWLSTAWRSTIDRIILSTGNIMNCSALIRNSLSGLLAGCSVYYVVLATPTPAWSGACSRSQANAAQTATSDLDNWTKVYLFFSKFGGCDDGGIADGVSEAIVRLMSDKWTELPLFADAAKEHPGFRKFVLSHVDSTADTGDLKKIRANSSQLCPLDLSALCKEIGHAAQAALQ
jgi:hypothetical protein